LTRFLHCGCLVVLVSLAGAALTHPAFAKGGHGQHGTSTGSKTGPNAGSKAQSKNTAGKADKPRPQAPAASGLQPKGDVSAPSGEAPAVKNETKAPTANLGLKSPIKTQLPPIAHNPPVSVPVNTTTRNAIGMPVATHEPPAVPNAVGAHVPNAPAGSIGPAAKPVALPAAHPSPIASAGPTASGTIGGAGALRGVQATSALGGPAKPTAGINGSTLRIKR
jgi:hypothetical protein